MIVATNDIFSLNILNYILAKNDTRSKRNLNWQKVKSQNSFFNGCYLR